MTSLVQFVPNQKQYFSKLTSGFNRKIIYEKLTLFPGQATAKITFVQQSSYTADAPRRVWIDLDIFMTQTKILYFKINYSK